MRWPWLPLDRPQCRFACKKAKLKNALHGLRKRPVSCKANCQNASTQLGPRQLETIADPISVRLVSHHTGQDWGFEIIQHQAPDDVAQADADRNDGVLWT